MADEQTSILPAASGPPPPNRPQAVSSRPPTTLLMKLHGVDDQTKLAGRLASWRTAVTADGSVPRFSLARTLGEGAQGVVYAVHDRDTRRDVALKAMRGALCDGDEISRFIHEAQVTAQLEHPGIVPVHDVAVLDDGTVFYTMKQVEGSSLADHLAGRAGVEACRFDLLQLHLKICDTMAFAHSRGVVHRDLKPRNIMVGQFGEVLVMDWGLAKVITTDGPDKPQDPKHGSSARGRVSSYRSETMDGDDIHRTMQGAAVGTPAYMSPEQARGDLAQVDQRSDVYGLGVILYEMLTGTSPYRRGDVRETLDQVANGRIIPIERQPMGATVPRALAAIVRRAMAVYPGQRYATVSDLATDLRAFLAGLAVAAHAETPAERMLRFCRRHGKALQMGALAVVAVAGIGTFLWYRENLRIDETVNRLRLEASRFELSGDLREARERWGRILDYRPDDRTASKNVDRLDQRILYLEKERREQAAAALLAEAKSLAATGTETGMLDALERIARARQVYPEDPVAVEAKASLQQQLDALRRTTAEAARIAEAARTAAIAQAAADRGDLDDAVRTMHTAVQLSAADGRQEQLNRLVERLADQRAQERQAAKEAARIASEQESRHRADGFIAAALAAAAEGRGSAAQAQLQQAVGIDPANPSIASTQNVVALALARERAAAADLLRSEAATYLRQADTLAGSIDEIGNHIHDLRRQLTEANDPATRTSLGAAETNRAAVEAQRAAALAKGVAALQQALAIAPDHQPVRRDLTLYHLDRLREAEAAGNTALAAAAEAQASAFADGADEATTLVLAGEVIVRCPVGAPAVVLTRLMPGEDRRLVPVGTGIELAPGATTRVKVGRWLLAAGPVQAARRFDRRGATYEVVLPPVRPVPADVAIIPRGEIYGADGRRDGEVATFGLARHEVTCGEWLQFLNSDPTLQRHAEVRRERAGMLILVPRDTVDAAEPIWPQEPSPPWRRWQSRFNLPRPIDAHLPVSGISAEDADAYVAWRRSRDGLPWRLPTEREWRLAAQGGDGRAFPWGDAPDPGFCHSARAADLAGTTGPVAQDAFPTDCSVQGVHDLAGAVCEMVQAQGDRPRRTACGGSFSDYQEDRFSAWSRREFEPRMVSINRGLRLALDLP